MVVPEEREGRTGAAMMLSRDPSKATDAVNTRKAGGQDGEKKASRKVSLNFEHSLRDLQIQNPKTSGISSIFCKKRGKKFCRV